MPLYGSSGAAPGGAHPPPTDPSPRAVADRYQVRGPGEEDVPRGPFTRQQILSMWGQGLLGATDRYRPDEGAAGRGPWRPLREFCEAPAKVPGSGALADRHGSSPAPPRAGHHPLSLVSFVLGLLGLPGVCIFSLLPLSAYYHARGPAFSDLFGVALHLGGLLAGFVSPDLSRGLARAGVALNALVLLLILLAITLSNA